MILGQNMEIPINEKLSKKTTRIRNRLEFNKAGRMHSVDYFD